MFVLFVYSPTTLANKFVRWRRALRVRDGKKVLEEEKVRGSTIRRLVDTELAAARKEGTGLTYRYRRNAELQKVLAGRGLTEGERRDRNRWKDDVPY